GECGHLHAMAVGGELPAVVRTLEVAVLDAAQGQAGTAVRALVAPGVDEAGGVAPEDEIFSENARGERGVAERVACGKRVPKLSFDHRVALSLGFAALTASLRFRAPLPLAPSQKT